jgi:hypothetical protein
LERRKGKLEMERENGATGRMEASEAGRNLELTCSKNLTLGSEELAFGGGTEKGFDCGTAGEILHGTENNDNNNNNNNSDNYFGEMGGMTLATFTLTTTRPRLLDQTPASAATATANTATTTKDTTTTMTAMDTTQDDRRELALAKGRRTKKAQDNGHNKREEPKQETVRMQNGAEEADIGAVNVNRVDMRITRARAASTAGKAAGQSDKEMEGWKEETKMEAAGQRKSTTLPLSSYFRPVNNDKV